jgi:colicin import membrane protein
LPDPQIAIEKARREEAKRVADEQAQQQKREKAAREKEAREDAERDKRAKDELAQKKADKEKVDKAEAAKQEAIRAANLKRIAGMAGATGGETDTGNALRSSAPSANYAGRVVARVRPNILLTNPIDGNPKADVEVRLAPDGTIISRRIVKSSGVQVWDDAVLRAIDRTGTLPRDVDGRAPPQLTIGFTHD